MTQVSISVDIIVDMPEANYNEQRIVDILTGEVASVASDFDMKLITGEIEIKKLKKQNLAKLDLNKK